MPNVRAVVGSNTVKARVGPQNAVRVLSNASSPPVNLIDLNDVNADLRNQDGLLLVWDLPSETFIMTSVIDSSSTTIEGIAYFTNTEGSTLPTNGAIVVSGGVGIGENLNVGGDLTVTGITTFNNDVNINAGEFTVNVGAAFTDIVVSGFSTFLSDVDIDAFVSILNGATISGTTSVETLNVSQNSTFEGVVEIENTAVIDTANINVANITTLNVSGISTLDDLDINGDLNVVGFISVTEGLYYDDEYDGPNGIAFFDNNGKLTGAASTESAIDTSNYILTTLETAGIGTPVWTSTIDGGEY
jgi:hypothetical protein